MRALSHPVAPPAPQRRTAPRRAPARHGAAPWSEGLSAEIRTGPTGPVVVVRGELDAAGERLLTAVLEYLAAVEGGPVAVDLRAVPFADTHGLAPLLRPGVVLVAASPEVTRLLALMGAPPPRGGPPVPSTPARRPGGPPPG
ncbi:STAS domain-containing protein [Geodermatophilus marinus]|uniref:STAS domain-containing protein n=1 Tax=Geodermatophilus sp. LHW52908 TaxID=2303986 RepID=UPI000E3BE50B|nr:STAS domain-containing protein [Geodermatophilus sp. LHW52908]RFU22541.1 anti-sigma factor antagonist [Geodermatophilus sp. LHW52908]